MRTFLFIALLLPAVLAATRAHAIEGDAPSITAKATQPSPATWHLGLGYAFANYPQSYQAVVDTLKREGASHLPFAFDVGYYHPHFYENSLFGVCIRGFRDTYHVQNDSASTTEAGVYASFLHFFGPAKNLGWMARSDLGLATIGESVYGNSNTTSSTGFGVTAGGGYAWQFNDSLNLIAQGTLAYRHVNRYGYSDFSFTIGTLF